MGDLTEVHVNESVCMRLCWGGWRGGGRLTVKVIAGYHGRETEKAPSPVWLFLSHFDQNDRNASKVQLIQVARSHIADVFGRATVVKVVLLTSSMRRCVVQASGTVAGLESIRFHYGSDQCPTAQTTQSVQPNTALIKYKTLARRNKTHTDK